MFWGFIPLIMVILGMVDPIALQTLVGMMGWDYEDKYFWDGSTPPDLDQPFTFGNPSWRAGNSSIDDFSPKGIIYRGFSIAIFDYRRVTWICWRLFLGRGWGGVQWETHPLENSEGIIMRPGRVCGEVRFDCAGPVFDEIRDVVHLRRCMTRFISKTLNPKPETLNPRP